MFVLYNYYREDWLPQKIGGMLEDAFGTPPIVRAVRAGRGDARCRDRGSTRRRRAAPGRHGRRARPWRPRRRRPPTTGRSCTCVEPYIAPYYLGALAVILSFALLVVWRAARRSGIPLRRFSPHFFLLGVAFLLLETRSLVTFSLLFGSTWIVNSLVFFAVLASVLLAIAINCALPDPEPGPAVRRPARVDRRWRTCCPAGRC